VLKRAKGLLERAPTPLLALLVASVPTVLTFGLLHSYLGVTHSTFVPDYVNDQVGYWSQINNFHSVGFDAGYGVNDEKEAALGFLHTGLHGPAYPVTYGLIAKMVGWGFSTGFFVNMAMLGIGVLAFAYLARLDRVQMTVLAVVVATFWPLMLFVPSIFQENLNQAVALVIAGLFVRLIREPASGPRIVIPLFSLILYASVLRLSWLFLLLPALLLTGRVAGWRAALKRTVIAGAGISAMYVLIGLMTAPGSVILSGEGKDGVVGIGLDAVHDFFANIPELLTPSLRPAESITPAAVAVNYPTAMGAILATVAFLLAIGKPSRDPGLETRREWAFHALNLLPVTVASLALYLPPGFYRVMGASLLVSLAALVAFRRWRLLAVATLVSIVTFPSFLTLYRDWDENFRFEPRQIARQQKELAEVIKFRKDAPSAWCNTMLVPIDIFDWRVTLFPDGIGATAAVFHDELKWPVKSEYFIVNAEVPEERLGYVRYERLERLGRFDVGTVYRNLDSECGRS